MNRFIMSLAVIAAPLAAHAATLGADTLLCESEAVALQSATLIIAGGVHPPASQALEIARDYMRLHGSRFMSGLSAESHLILAMSDARLPAKLEPYRQVLLTCASSGEMPLTGVEIVVRRPISGLAQVKAKLNGQPGVF